MWIECGAYGDGTGCGGIVQESLSPMDPHDDRKTQLADLRKSQFMQTAVGSGLSKRNREADMVALRRKERAEMREKRRCEDLSVLD